MGQKYKSIYFADHPGETAQQKNMTLALGVKDRDVYEFIKPLSSYELRELIGHFAYASLQQAADREGLSVNTFCIRLMRQRLRDSVKQDPLPNFSDAAGTFIEPIQATFKGGQAEPLHNWYPYLEGYSPRFVIEVIRNFAPSAKRILDPFSGSGTTPLTVAKLGRQAFYCELNPLLQYLTEAKMLALTLSEHKRFALASRLREVGEQFESLVGECEPDQHLAAAYSDTFGGSVFFEQDVNELVLRTRTAIDRLACIDPIASVFITVAVLASLIPSSRLVRRGDLRFRNNDELERGIAPYLPTVSAQLSLIADDLERLTSIDTPAQLVCEDAHRLATLPPFVLDAVVTSPPYLNGTNYFRNTKLELWFLRCLSSNKDLSAFRFRAVTAGINDVTVAKLCDELDPRVKEVVRQLEIKAYDARIPRMVASYFNDMKTVFSGLRQHLVDDAPVLVDIGDSLYSDVHVPTDELLTATLSSLGYRCDSVVTLRRRMSRNGSTLRQVLLAFHYHPERRRVISEVQSKPWPAWMSAWGTFKAGLPHQQGQFAKRNWGHPLHSLCSYQGKMKPSLASHLVETFVPDHGTVLDPFAGAGTIPFEAALQGKFAWAFEISPAALVISAAKLGRANTQDCERMLAELEAYITTHHVTEVEQTLATQIRFNGPLPDYFHPNTMNEVLLARRYFREHPPTSASQSLVLASLLHILHGNRPYALSRRSHPITPFAPTGPTEYRALIPRLREKVLRSLAVAYPTHFQSGEVIYQDAISWWPQHVDKLDAIITSPPFFDSTRFYLANWMRLWFMGWGSEDFQTRPLAFVDERQKQSLRVYEPIFRQARERLKPSGVLVLHLGKSRKCDMAATLADVAQKWFRVADIFSENVEHCESHGIRDKGTVEEHSYLVLH